MGFLLKEVLKTLCSRNRWSYAVFWKIGCNNSKLLIWEDHYYEPLPSPFPPRHVGMSNFPYRDGEGCWFSSESQLGIQEEDRVGGLINKMMLNNSVSIAGEGMVGRATFTGNYQWILMNNFSRDAYPPQVYTELHYQFSAGMQTVAVIPVLPHGVVQFGSLLPIMEDIGFVNDVKNLILQLGCVPGALLSEDYSAKVSSERLGVPVTIDPPVVTSKCTPSAANGSNQLTDSTIASRSIAPSPHPPRQEIDNYQASVLTPQTYDQNQIFDSICQPKSHSMIKTIAYGQQKKTVVHAEAKVIPTNFDSCMQQPSAYNSRSAFNELAGFNQSNLSCNLNYMEQQTSGVGRQSHVNPNMNPSSASNMPQLKTGAGKILEQNQSSGGSSLFGGIPMCGGSNLLRTNMINCSVSNSPKVPPTSEFSGSHKLEFGLQNNNSTTDAGLCSVPTFCNQSVTSHVNLENSAQKNLPIDLKHAFVSTEQRIPDDLLHTALNIPSLHLEENEPMRDHIPGFVQDCLNKDVTGMVKMNVKHEDTYTQLPSGDDLFDVLGVDLKRQLLNGNWDNLLATDSEANRENLDKKATCMNLQGVRPDNSYSVKEAISDSGIFSGTGTDHLLDAVVSKAQSAPKQSSDEISCRTTLTRVSTASVSSPACNQVLSDHVLKGLFDFPKNGAKRAAGETSSLRSGCSKDEAGNCSQMTSIYGSKLSSWVENGSSVKRESSVSTGYSKRPEEVCKSNRKRLKPGENPRPRPKDRQMIQDRVKELREIVPNGAKCSIDALLEKTIKHMLFLQSVTKHADKLKQTGESKIVSKEGGLLLKDNFEGGATWAYEVGSQSMVCPIIVEDLNPPRQMLVEMLCEERGFFLEIADLIRGLGLTILKGVMEARNDKIWARFAVEANRDVTRMEIFMSLVRLLDQTVKGGAASSNATDNNMMMYHSFPQATQIAATGRPSSLQ
ncbi:transcription factor LHW-like [Vigna unguiculata]|uniref:transcription factor LHW-like n=1 Tax=Vigna unguiculata TaxID=3917 RepID=UPI0010161546|nr:transcription factor LHW-like [Vigna unguiculata]